MPLWATPTSETARCESRHEVLLEVGVRDVPSVVAVALGVGGAAVAPFAGPVSAAGGPVVPAHADAVSPVLIRAPHGVVVTLLTPVPLGRPLGDGVRGAKPHSVLFPRTSLREADDAVLAARRIVARGGPLVDPLSVRCLARAAC